MKKNKGFLLLLIPLLLGCQTYAGPTFYVNSDSHPAYVLLDSIASFHEMTNQLSNFIFVLGVTSCQSCQNLDGELETYVQKEDYSIHHLYYDQSINSENDYSILTSIINGENNFLPIYHDSFYVPIIFIIQNKVAVYSINNDFISILGHCIKTF